MKIIHKISISNFTNLSLKGSCNTSLVVCNKSNDDLLLIKKILIILIIKNTLISSLT